MRIAYLECFSGISGDMFLGALLDAGVPPEVFTRTVEALGVDARLEISRVDRSGISATKLDVIAAGEKELPREEAFSTQHSALSPARPSSVEHSYSHGAAEPHSHEHSHSHEGSHDHGHSDDHADSHSHIPPGAAVPHEHGHDHSPEHSHSHTHDHSHQHEHGSKNAHSHRGLKEIRQIIQAAGISQSAKDRAIKIFEALGAAEAKVHNTDIEKIHFHEV